MALFGDLSYKVTNGAVSSATSMGNMALQDLLGVGGGGNGPIEYYYNHKPGANFMLVHSAPILRASAQLAKDAALKAVGKLLGNKTKKEPWKTLNTVDKYKGAAGYTLIKNYANTVKEKHYGMLEVNGKGSGQFIPALDSYGDFCPEAFIMGIKLENSISCEVNVHKGTSPVKTNQVVIAHKKVNGKPQEEKMTIPETTDTLVWYDCVAIPQMNSDKNVILTPVQGRDYTRKEIVGNGDIRFSVSGKMCSGVPGVYPAHEVEKFIQIMKYKGLVYCNHYILSILGINKFIVTGWSLSPRQGFGDNTQDYSFSAVGVMPDEETKIQADSINILDYEIKESSSSKKGRWAKLLDNKLEGLKNGALDTANKAAGKGINSLIGKLG